MDDRKTDRTDQDVKQSVVETEEEREAVAEGESPQDFRAERETAEGRTSFGDDAVTPRLNDGR